MYVSTLKAEQLRLIPSFGEKGCLLFGAFMGRSPCCAKEGLNRGAWTAAEDRILSDYIKMHGEGKWRSLPKRAGKPIPSEKKKKKS